MTEKKEEKDMTLTSAQAAKLLKKLNIELRDLYFCEEKTGTFLAAVGEDVESVRPEYDYEDVRRKVETVGEKIRKVKHAMNEFNTTTVIPEFGMTIDEMLVYIPQLTHEIAVLEKMKSRLPKERQDTYGRNSANLIDYLYANYDIRQAEKDYDTKTDLLARAQLALDRVNSTETMEIEL